MDMQMKGTWNEIGLECEEYEMLMKWEYILFAHRFHDNFVAGSVFWRVHAHAEFLPLEG